MAMFSPDGGGGISATPVANPYLGKSANLWTYWTSGAHKAGMSFDDFTDAANGFGRYASLDSAPPTSADEIDKTVPDDVNLYYYNMEREKEAARQQMDFQTKANKEAMQFSADQTQIQRDWYEKMMHDAYSIEVESLKKAGLNPALAYSHGSPSIPSVTAASGVTSAGSKASFSDTGYKYYDLVMDQKRLNYAYTQMVVNAATDIIGSVLKFVK